MRRSLPKKTSAMLPSASSASASSATIGSPLRLPLVMISGMPSSASSSRCWTGVAGSMRPISGSAPATEGARVLPPASPQAAGPLLSFPLDAGASFSRRASKTMGRAGDASSAASASPTWHSVRVAARSRTMTASGLLGRRLRSRSIRTAASSRASQARCQPPRPFSAAILPSRRAAAIRSSRASEASRACPARSISKRSAPACPAALRSASPASPVSPRAPSSFPSVASANHSDGPHAKQASGWAW